MRYFIAFLAVLFSVLLYTASMAQASQPVDDGGLFAWLGTNPAISILIFVLVSFIATRALDAGLKDKIPKWLLPIVSAIMGVAGQVSVALVAGVSWKQAIAFGIVSGLGGAGFYSAGGKFLPKMQASSEK